LKLREGQRELTSGAFYSMGVALPLAVGAAVTEPKAQVIAITGDGSIELNIQELRTVSHNNLNIKLFVLNNGGYASIRQSQDDMVGGRYTDDTEVLNFSKISDAFELPYHVLVNYHELDEKIPEILDADGPALIEVVCDQNQKIIEPFENNP
jgi:acetolactate synthase-1/2/3 large subunit